MTPLQPPGLGDQLRITMGTNQSSAVSSQFFARVDDVDDDPDTDYYHDGTHDHEVNTIVTVNATEANADLILHYCDDGYIGIAKDAGVSGVHHIGDADEVDLA